MTRPQQPSILSFFQPKSLPQHAAPPSNGGGGGGGTPPNGNTGDKQTTTASSQPPPAPPVPPGVAAAEPQPFLPFSSVPVSVTTTTVVLPQTIPVLPSPPSLPSQASIVPLEEHHIPALRRINSLLLPVAYSDSFYSRILDPLASGLFSRAILWRDEPGAEAKVVGGVICRLEPNQFVDPQSGRPRPLPPPPPPKRFNNPNDQETFTESQSPFFAIYIQSLSLLSPYRSQGLAAAALEHIIASAAILPAAGSSIDARTIYAHVWTENGEALRWYASRGFRSEGRSPIQGYYFKLRPDTAWIMRRDIGPGSDASPGVVASYPSVGTNNGNKSNNVGIKNGVVASAVNLPAILPKPPASAPPGAVPTGPPRPSGPPRGLSATSASSAATSSLSFQNARPETEWNDLPEDMVVQKPSANSSSTNLLSPPSGGADVAGGAASGASSRSSSVAGRKKDRKRAYPAAAFGQ